MLIFEPEPKLFMFVPPPLMCIPVFGGGAIVNELFPLLGGGAILKELFPRLGGGAILNDE